MEAFDPSMFPHLVTLYPQSEGEDAVAGVEEEFPANPPAAPLPCRIRYSGNRSGIAGDGETSVTLAQVAFPADPGCSRNDILRSQAARNIRALGPSQARDGDGSLFVVAGEVVD